MPRNLAFSLVAFFALAALASSAPAQDGGDACEAYADIPINITPRFDKPAYNYSVSIAELQALASDPRRTVHAAHRGLALGLTRYEPVIEFHVPVKTVEFPDGLACAHVDHVDVSFGYKDVTVYVPSEIPRQSCGFAQVIAHEQKHIAVNRALLDEYVPIIRDKLEAYLKLNGVFREKNAAYATSILKDKLQDILNQISGEMLAENRRRQELVDSPEEYRRVGASCNGQLIRTANWYYRTGK